MNILIISQYLDTDGKGEDRFFKLGRELVSRGHTVTTLTSNGAVDMDLGRKKIGLFQKNGLNVIAFNVPYASEMTGVQKAYASLKFARMAGVQGRSLPGPDLIMVKSPPLTAAIPALRLSAYYGAALVVECRELWPDVLIERGHLKNALVIKALKRLEQDIYEKAGRIIALDQEVAKKIKERWVERAKISVIEDTEDEKALIAGYDSAFKGMGLEKTAAQRTGSEK